MTKKKSNGPAASEELLLLIERWERLQEEKQAIADDQKDVMAEAKSRGYDVTTVREIIKLRKMRPDERREREALLDTYKAALGMLDGTPLGHWAIERLKKGDAPPPPQDPESGQDNGDQPDGATEAPAAPAEPPPPAEPELTVDDARRLGTEAARGGAAVTANPFPAFDERRAAWDEAWCAALGSDGMDIPDALKPTPKAKKGDADGKPGDAA